MNLFLAIFLGLIQGLTEFLPVSSSGHLLLLQKIFNMPDDMIMFDIILHIATLCAVIIVFRKKIWELIRNPFCKTNYCLLMATVITCSMVVLFKDTIDSLFTYKVLPITFMVTAIVLFTTTIFSKNNKKVDYKTSVISGIAQGIAVVPGFSRSGFTISACLLTGTKRENAAEFSFLMSIPIIMASFVYELISAKGTIALDIMPTALAFIVALVSGIIAIKFMLKIIKEIKLYWFSIYLVILSFACLIL